MAKKQQVVIKKIIVQGGGHHGGGWKVALADFMTALMAFFLTMWLLGQSDQTKKAISDYFSTPSMIEYNYQNFGAELTLEKLFLDFVNDPLEAVKSFMEPPVKSPNILDMGSEKIVAAYMADRLTDVAKNVSISKDGFEFDIPDVYLFEKGSAEPKPQFVEIMDKLITVTTGLKDADVRVTSALFIQLVPDQQLKTAENVAQKRLALVQNKIAASFDNNTNSITGAINVRDKKGDYDIDRLMGFIRVSIQQKPTADPDKKRRKLESLFDDKVGDRKLNFKRKEAQTDSNVNNQIGEDPNLVNPLDQELQKMKNESFPAQEAEEIK